MGAGERTIVRVYLDDKGDIGIYTMAGDLDEGDHYKVIGALAAASKNMVDYLTFEDINQEETDRVRKLLD